MSKNYNHVPFTKEHCLAISESKKGCVSNRKGVTLTPEIIQKQKDGRGPMDDRYKQKIKDGFSVQDRIDISARLKKYYEDTADERHAASKKKRNDILASIGLKIEEIDGRFFIKDLVTSAIVQCQKGYKDYVAAFALAKRNFKNKQLED